MLTPQQMAHFDTFGLLFLRRVFSAPEMQETSRVAEALWHEDRQRRTIVGGTNLKRLIPDGCEACGCGNGGNVCARRVVAAKSETRAARKRRVINECILASLLVTRDS